MSAHANSMHGCQSESSVRLLAGTWVGAKTNGKITVDWVSDGRQSDENLPVLLKGEASQSLHAAAVYDNA